MATNRIHARLLLRDQLVVFPVYDIMLPNPLVYSNADRFVDLPFQTWLLRGNISRNLSQSEVLIGRYPGKSYLDTGTSYSLEVSGFLVREQLAPWIKGDFTGTPHDDPARILRSITGPCLLASRFGETTWGHWLIEILPKIVIAETVFPNRFKYIVPGTILRASAGRSYASAVIESLAAYGISLDRIVEVSFPQLVEFTDLYDVCGVFADGIHPFVVKLMQDRVQAPEFSDNKRSFASLRKPTDKRAVANRGELASVVASLGFHVDIDLTQLTFVQQVDLFRRADCITAEIGSNLAGIIYSQNCIDILTIAPNGWRDGYFVNILQRLNARQADVRGATTFSEARNLSQSTHVVNPADVIDAFRALNDCSAEYDRVGRTVAGRPILRTVPKSLKLITFGRTGNARNYQKDGWAEAEETHTWSLGSACSIRIDFPAHTVPSLWLEMRGIACMQDNFLPHKMVEILVNGILVHSFATESAFHERFILPKETLGSHGLIELVILHPVAPSPLDLSISSDPRPLGLGFIEIALQAPSG